MSDYDKGSDERERSSRGSLETSKEKQRTAFKRTES